MKFETDIGPPGHFQSPAQDFEREFPQHCRGGGFVHEMKAPAARLAHHLLHPVHQLCGRNAFIPADVVEGRVAEGAFGPVAAVREHHFVPPSVAPEPVHRIGHFGQRQIFVVRQAAEVGTAAFGMRQRCGLSLMVTVPGVGAQQVVAGEQPLERSFAVVEDDVVDIPENGFIGHRAQFG